jgi:heme/copper-type cytochrome/quinol oxidase subunit 3
MSSAHALPAPPLERPRVLMVGTAFMAAASIMVIFGMLGVYLAQRADFLSAGSVWLPTGASIPLQQPNTMMITLIMSVITMQWAVNAISRNDRGHAYMALGLTLVLGASTIVMTSYLFTLMELDISSGLQGVLIYSITGAHLLMLIVAMIFVALMAFRALGGQFAARQHDGISAAALYWDAMVAVYSVLWISIYITK